MTRILALFPVFLIFFTSCSREEKNNDLCVFRYNQPNAITSLDPAFARNQSNIWAVDHLYNTLIQLDDSLHLQPCLAKRWEVDTSGKLYRFILDTEIKFHDDPCFKGGKGRTIEAKDVVFSLNRIIDKKVASPGSWIFNGRVDTVKPFVAVNDSTFEVRLLKPFMPFLQLLSMQYCSVVPHEAVEVYGKSFRSHPVGTGPFYLKTWIEGQAMILNKNPDYFEYEGINRLPYVDVVRVSFIGDKKTSFLQLMEGNLDFMSGFDPSMTTELFTADGQLRKQYADKIFCYKAPYLNTEYLGINLNWRESSPLLNRDFRRALNYSIDRKGLLETLRRNIGTPALSSFPPYGLPSFDEEKVKGFAYNPVMARQLLEKSGYLKVPLTERPVLSLYTAKDYSDFCLYVAKQWELLGVRCKVELAESATVREMMRNGKVLFFRGSWLADYPDAENYLTVFYGKNPAPPNYTHFRNTEYDRLYEASLLCKDEYRRFELYHKMEKILIDESPVIFLFYDGITNFTTHKITHYHTNPINLLKVKYIRKKCSAD
ncbi:MAG: ABC transporter substrate-binding protein [Saprospiraceae bacterium]|nr:ABC transporter substrate-binding protein [Saprospiraceae bacterium]